MIYKDFSLKLRYISKLNINIIYLFSNDKTAGLSVLLFLGPFHYQKACQSHIQCKCYMTSLDLQCSLTFRTRYLKQVNCRGLLPVDLSDKQFVYCRVQVSLCFHGVVMGDLPGMFKWEGQTANCSSYVQKTFFYFYIFRQN